MIPRREAWRWKPLDLRLRDRIREIVHTEPELVIGVVIIAAILAVMSSAQWIAQYNPEDASGGDILQPPSARHWFGTDGSGLDVFARTLYAPRIDMAIGLAATLLSIAIGVPLGLAAGLWRFSKRRAPRLVSAGILRLTDVSQAFPVFILALGIAATVGPRFDTLVAAIAFVNAPLFLRLTYAEAVSVGQAAYVEAARAAGARGLRIALRHVLPNSLAPTVTSASATIGWAVLLTAGLSFVGAGVRPPTPEWGAMIANGAQEIVTGQWWTAVFPGAFLSFTVVGFALIGESLGRGREARGIITIREELVEVPDTSL